VYEPEAFSVADLKQEIQAARGSAMELISRIERSAERLKKLGQLAKEAV
jgi:hypothetical protein